MASITILSMCALFTLANARLKEYPKDAEVSEGTWANFTCTIKPPGTIWWRIGSLVHRGHESHTFDQLGRLEGFRAEKDNIRTSKNPKRYSETIEIFATKERDGTPVECKFEHHDEREYSPFALLKVYPRVDSDHEEGSGATNIRCLRSVLDNEVSHTEMPSGETQRVTMALLSVTFCSVVATMARL